MEFRGSGHPKSGSTSAQVSGNSGGTACACRFAVRLVELHDLRAALAYLALKALIDLFIPEAGLPYKLRASLARRVRHLTEASLSSLEDGVDVLPTEEPLIDQHIPESVE